MEQTIEVRIGWFFYFLMIVLGLFSFGILSLVLWLSTRVWPRRLERDFLIQRDGTKIPWSECSNVVTMPGGRLDLIFGATTVPVPKISIHRGKHVQAWIRERLGVK